MDDDTLQFRDAYQSQAFNGSSRCVHKPSVRFQTKQAASDVDFRIERDDGRNPENNNSQRKLRKKPMDHISAHSQYVYQHSMDSHFEDHHTRTDPHKLEASRLDDDASKIAASHVKNRSSQYHQHQQQCKPSSLRVASAHQSSQYHRPGTSRARNHSGNPMGHHLPRKDENYESCQWTGIESPNRDIVNSDVEPEDTDFRHSRDRNHSRNICNKSNVYWHSPPGEPHFEPEINSSALRRHRDYPESKKRHSGQGESVYDGCDLNPELALKTGSTLDKDLRQQCERDQQELKDLYEDLGEFAKRKSVNRVGHDTRHGQDYAWDYPKQQRRDRDEETESQDLLESLNQLVGKVMVQRNEKVPRVASCPCAECSRTRSRIPKDQSRNRSSKPDGRKTYHPVGTNGRNVAAGRNPEPEINLDDELADIRLDSLNDDAGKDEYEDDEEIKDVESLSETEEEARELAGDDSAIGHNRRRGLTRNSVSYKRRGDWNSRLSSKCERTDRDAAGNGDEKIYRDADSGKKGMNDNRQRRKDKRDKEVVVCERSELSRQQRVGTNEAERKDSKRSSRTYGEFDNFYGVSGIDGAGDLELETSKTKTCIDEMIDSGLSREANRGTTRVTTRDAAKNLQRETDVPDGDSSKRVTSDEESKIIHPDEHSSPEGPQTDNKLSRVSRDCFCKTLAEIVPDCRDPHECVKELKDRRWLYLNHMQMDLENLYGLEKLLDSCSTDDGPSSGTFAVGFNPELKDSKNVAEKLDKAKVSSTQMRL